MDRSPQFPDRELAELCDELLEGSLTDARARLLNDRLKREASARRAYLETIELEAQLHYEFPNSAETQVSGPAVAAHVGMGQGEASPQALLRSDETAPRTEEPKHKQSSPAPLRRLLWLASGLAAVFAGVLLFLGLPRRAADSDAPNEESIVEGGTLSTPIARVTRLAGMAAGSGNAPFVLGSLLTSGTVRQDSGQLELTLDSGVVLVLNAGAVVDLESPMRIYVRQGRVTATVPEPARGFVVNTPTSFIRDLGTQFGIDVSDTSGTEVHVLRGRVEAAATAGNDRTVLVHTAQAVRIGTDGVRGVPFSEEEFSFAMTGPELDTIERHLSWSFDAAAPNGFASVDGGPALLPGPAPETGPRPTPGVFGAGLAFNGRTDALEAPGFFGIGGDRARTLAFWVAIPPEAPPAGPNGIVSWGRNAGGEKWQLSWNCDAASGVVGALRQEFGLGYVIGSTDLRDGRWHHVAVVFLGGTDVDVSTHVKLYVDGRLEPQSGRKQQTIRTSVDPSETRPLSVGRYVGPYHRIPPRHFLGRIDELHLFEGALTPRQIWRLMHANRVE